MADIKKQLESDLKQAMLSRDEHRVSTLKGMKSALQYASVELGVGQELSEEQTVKVLQKESKKRTDAADIYAKAGDSVRAEKENAEKQIIDGYLPELMSEEEVSKLVDEIVAGQVVTQQSMGKIIGEVRSKSGGLADGSLIAKLVKEKIDQ